MINIILITILSVCQILISLMPWVVVPFNFGMVFSDLDIKVLYILGVSSLGVYGIITSGWAINSKYGFLRALRSAG